MKGFTPKNVKLLLDMDADPLAKNKSGYTPLEYALASGEDTLNRLCELAVKWVHLNPIPIGLAKVEYSR